MDKNGVVRSGKQGKSNDLTDYTVYVMSAKETGLSMAAGAMILFGIGFIFYKSVGVSILFMAGSITFPTFIAERRKKKRQQELTLQFKQALYALSSALSAGKSLENAVSAVIADLRMLYPDPQTYIIREFMAIHHQVENGIPIEKSIQQFGIRTGIEEILQFADVLSTCKRTGGNLVNVIRRTTDIIGDKLEIQQEIFVMVAQKRFESRVMAVAPLVVVAMLSFSSPDYMAPLYNGIGYAIMTVNLLLLVFCFWIIHKVMRFKV